MLDHVLGVRRRISLSVYAGPMSCSSSGACHSCFWPLETMPAAGFSIESYMLQVHAAMSTLVNLCVTGSRANTPAVLDALVSGLEAGALSARCRCAEVRLCFQWMLSQQVPTAIMSSRLSETRKDRRKEVVGSPICCQPALFAGLRD